jgi:DNA-binding MarR family transcriptional regulator
MSPTVHKAIRQKRPFRSVHEETLVTLVRTTDRVNARLCGTLTAEGLSVQQYNVLRVLRGAEPEGLQTYQVAERLVARAPNITRLVDKMEAKGLLARTRSVNDRRVVQLRISAKGLQLLTRLDAPTLESVRAAMEGLPETDLTELCRLLNKLREPLEGGAG